MNKLSTDQANEILDIESFNKITGRRFRLTKEESAAGMSREDALQERLDNALNTPQKANKPAAGGKGGTITLTIRPAVGVDASYLTNLPRNITITQDDKWFGWYCTKLECPYEGNAEQLMEHILNLGIGEVIDKYHFPEDLKNE